MCFPSNFPCAMVEFVVADKINELMQLKDFRKIMAQY